MRPSTAGKPRWRTGRACSRRARAFVLSVTVSAVVGTAVAGVVVVMGR